MAKGRGAPGFLQRLQQSNAAKSRALVTKVAADTYSVDFRNAPEPERVYYAREAWIDYEQGMVSMYFCQRRRDDESKLRSLVCVTLAPDNALRFLKSVEEIESPSLQEIIRNTGINAETPKPIGDEAEQTVELSATVIRVAVSSYDSVLDFYKIPPISVADAKTVGAAIKTVPQVRIDLRTSLLMGLIGELQGLKKQMPAYALERAAVD